MKKQIIYIGGGESFLKHEDYLERLNNRPLWHMEEESNLKTTTSWKTTLEEELGDAWRVIIPPMPNRENAKYEEWKIWFERHFEYLSDGAVLVGCSLGAMFLGKYLTEETTPFKTGGVILMAAALPLDDIDTKDCGDFLVDFDAISAVTDKHERVIIMHSKDDFVVPYTHGEKLAELLPKAEFITFEDKNHFLIPEFPELVEKIKELA